MARHANLVEEAMEPLNDSGHLLGQIAGVHDGGAASSTPSADQWTINWVRGM